MSLLTVVQNAMTLAGLPTPSSAFSNTNDTVEQFIRLVYIEGRDLMKRHDWNLLLTTQTLTCGASAPQSGYPVAAFDRMARGTTMWNTTNDTPIYGPMNSDEWSQLSVLNITSVTQYWRLIGGVLNIRAPVSGDGIQYEYVSNKWIYQAASTLATTLIGDSDTFVFPENLMEQGLVWRFKQSKQLDYAEDLKTYEITLMDSISSDRGGRRKISTDREIFDRSNRTWGGTVTPV